MDDDCHFVYITKFKQKNPCKGVRKVFPSQPSLWKSQRVPLKLLYFTLWIEAVTWNDPVLPTVVNLSVCLRTSLCLSWWLWNGWFAVGSSLSWELFRCKHDLGLNSNFEGPCSAKQKCVCLCVCGGYWVAHKIHEFGKLRTISEKLQDICKIFRASTCKVCCYCVKTVKLHRGNMVPIVVVVVVVYIMLNFEWWVVCQISNLKLQYLEIWKIEPFECMYLNIKFG
jgi:hypothetical protein